MVLCSLAACSLVSVRRRSRSSHAIPEEGRDLWALDVELEEGCCAGVEILPGDRSMPDAESGARGRVIVDGRGECPEGRNKSLKEESARGGVLEVPARTAAGYPL